MLRGTIIVGICGAAMLAIGEEHATTPERGPLGGDEKIRFQWMQWWHFKKAGVSDEQLIKSLANVGTTLFADWDANPERGRLAKAHGMRYYFSIATSSMRGPAERLGARLAVDREGLICPEQFERYKAAGGNVKEPWGKYGEHNPAYVPCPLDPGPWDAQIFEPALKAVKEGWLDGIHFDLEPYGAYLFDQPGDMLCYCDDCFADFLQTKNISAKIERKDRYGWLKERVLIDEYLARLRQQLVTMLHEHAERIRAVNPDFGFSAYPAFSPENLRETWRLQGLAMGLNSPRTPFIVVDSTPYWEDHTRPWWEAPHDAYHKMGLKHVMGSWDDGLMGGHPEVDVSAVQAMYEFAMASDGFWRWGERAYTDYDWDSFAGVNRRLRQVEAKVGEYLLQGQRVAHFVTLVEHTGNPFLTRALITRTFKHSDRYLVVVNNGNTDWPVRVRLRFPRLSGDAQWSIHDPIHDIAYFQSDGTGTWDAASLLNGLVVTLSGRGELFLLLEPALEAEQPDPHRSVRSLEVAAHSRPARSTEPLADDSVPVSSQNIVFARNRTDAKGSGILMHDLDSGQTKTLFGVNGFCWLGQFSPSSKRVTAAVWTNGRGQVYVANATGGQPRNSSNNDFCDHSPRFSPDGQRIVFVSDRDGDWEVYSMRVDGSDVQRLTESPGVDRSPVYSPDGERIAFISDRAGDFDIYLMSADGTGQHALQRRAGNEYEPTWSPDGQWLAYTVQSRNKRYLRLSRSDGSAARSVANATNLTSIAFSPDGERLAAAFSNYANAGVLVVQIKAGEEAKIEKIVDVGPLKPRYENMNDWYGMGSASLRWVTKTFNGVSFSADGKELLYCSDQGRNGRFRIYTVPVPGGEPEPIANSEMPWPTATDWAR